VCEGQRGRRGVFLFLPSLFSYALAYINSATHSNTHTHTHTHTHIIHAHKREEGKGNKKSRRPEKKKLNLPTHTHKHTHTKHTHLDAVLRLRFTMAKRQRQQGLKKELTVEGVDPPVGLAVCVCVWMSRRGYVCCVLGEGWRDGGLREGGRKIHRE
jgi:hypothetical protein